MSENSVSIVIAYHSGFGHTARLADAVSEGASAFPDTSTSLVPVGSITEDQWTVLDLADAIIFGSPTYMGSASPIFHAFAYDTGKRWRTQAWEGKLAAGFTNSGAKGGDKLHTLQYFALLAAQHGMNWVNLGLPPGWNAGTASENDLNRLGVWLGAAAQSNVDEGPEQVHKSDLLTAAHLGRRVAEQAHVVRRGRSG
ncbi:flavodoxin family protein [Amycolatopsis sp. cmx-11-12]|uniref:flavodoxin family protein n=1 Tax=Amycolatopsis sp. cmx-11-12 TaxID=2785795 RepID=UPI003917DCE2